MKDDFVEPGDVIQINPLSGRTDLSGCLAIVDTITHYGIACYIPLPNKEVIEVRLKWDQFEQIGKSIWYLYD